MSSETRIRKFRLNAHWSSAYGSDWEEEIEIEQTPDMTDEDVEKWARDAAWEFACQFVESWAEEITGEEDEADY